MKKCLFFSIICITTLFLLFLFCTFKEQTRFLNHQNAYSNKEKINLIFSGDDGYITPLLTAFTSLSLNTKTPIKIHLLTNGFSDKNIKTINTLDTQLKNIEIKIIVVSPNLFENFPVNKRWSQTIYYRYLIPELLPDEKKGLYLDGDILVLTDLNDFYHLNLNKNIIAGVKDYFETLFLNRPLFNNLSFYINSGVLLIDLKKWRLQNITHKLFEATKVYQNQLSHFDQDVINLVLQNKIQPLPLKYNAQQRTFTPFNKTIYHYSGEKKPWKTYSFDYYEWYKYFDYTKAILNNNSWPFKSYLTYIIRKSIYYPLFYLNKIFSK